MNLNEFNTVVNAQILRCRETLYRKGHEYVFGDDRLEHFKAAAGDQNITPEEALWGMLAKHLTSLRGMCHNGSRSIDLWNEKITDSINYLFLLRALVEEEVDDEQN